MNEALERCKINLLTDFNSERTINFIDSVRLCRRFFFFNCLHTCSLVMPVCDCTGVCELCINGVVWRTC